MPLLPPFVLRHWYGFALAAPLLMLAVAWSSQVFGHLAPCHLCLKQREIYWLTAGIAAATSVYAVLTGRGRLMVYAYGLIALLFAAEAGLAAFHAGVEWHWWPGPMDCTASAGQVTPADMLKMLSGEASPAGPRCDQAAWRFGLSMAGYNALAAAGLCALTVMAALRARSEAPR